MYIKKKKQLNPDLSKGILFTIDKNNYSYNNKTWISENIFQINNSAMPCFTTHLVHLTGSIFWNIVPKAINIL